MKNILTVILFICFGTTILSQNLTTDTVGTSISFKIKNIGLNVNGNFPEYKIKANFDRDNLSNSYFSGIAIIKSIDTGVQARNKSLQKKDYFHSEQFPEMTLSSSEIKLLDVGRYEFKGELSIKGKTKTITFPFTTEETDEYIILKGAFEINRRDFRVGKSSLILSKKVRVSIIYKGLFK